MLVEMMCAISLALPGCTDDAAFDRISVGDTCEKVIQVLGTPARMESIEVPLLPKGERLMWKGVKSTYRVGVVNNVVVYKTVE